MSFIYKSLNGLEPIGAGEVQESFRLPMMTNGEMGLLSWGNVVDTIRAPLLSRIEALETSGGGGSAGGPSIWPTPRTLSLTGLVTGAVSVDGSHPLFRK